MILSIWGGRCKKCILKYNLLCQATSAAHRILGNCSLSIAPHYLSLTTLLNLTDKKLYERNSFQLMVDSNVTRTGTFSEILVSNPSRMKLQLLQLVHYYQTDLNKCFIGF